MSKRSSQRSKTAGFSLLELMIVVAIVGILAAIAYPSYQRQVLRTHRSQAFAALSDAAARQERFLSDNARYAADAAELGIATSTENGHYTIAVSNQGCGTAPCYRLTATATGAQTADTGCTVLTLDSAGNRTPPECWN